MTTPITGMPEIAESQANKYITHNTALRRLEAISFRVLSRTTAARPTSPAAGDSYIVPSGGSGWSGGVGDVEYYDGSAWQAVTAFEGLGLWIADEDVWRIFDGSAWGDPGFTTSYAALSDTDGAYGGKAGLAVIVNGSEDGLVFGQVETKPAVPILDASSASIVEGTSTTVSIVNHESGLNYVASVTDPAVSISISSGTITVTGKSVAADTTATVQIAAKPPGLPRSEWRDLSVTVTDDGTNVADTSIAITDFTGEAATNTNWSLI